MKFRSAIYLFLLLFSTAAYPQSLKPGFDKAEYIEMLRLSARVADSGYTAKIPAPQRFHFVYRSPVVGLKNSWDLWADQHSVAVISIRGTTQEAVSWLANFYAAMVPAKGAIQVADTGKFNYELATDPRAAVHVGWLVSLAFLAPDIVLKIDSCYKAGIKEFIIMGHSQGGGIGFLLTAYLYHLQMKGELYPDIRFKTYCSAGPKPGNLYFAYEYEAMTQNGWAYNVVNQADWVPEVPLSVQTVHDFNQTNPFTNAKALLKKQPFPKDLLLRYAYNRLDKPSRRAQRNYQKYLGKMASKMVKKNLPGFQSPEYFASSNYVRTGNTIVLPTDEAYYQLFPNSQTNIFIHHLHPPYLYLAEKLVYPGNIFSTAAAASIPDGNWELKTITQSPNLLDSLYPGRRPTLRFEPADNKVNGNTGCNSFSGKLTINGNAINIAEPLAMTRMACPGAGENNFLQLLKKVDSFSLGESKQLLLMSGSNILMEFSKKD